MTSSLSWMAPLFWMWLGGALPVALLAWADRRHHPEEAVLPLAAWLLTVALWPLFAAHSAWELMRGRIGL